MTEFETQLLTTLQSIDRNLDILGLNDQGLNGKRFPGTTEKCAMELERIAAALEDIAQKLPDREE